MTIHSEHSFNLLVHPLGEQEVSPEVWWKVNSSLGEPAAAPGHCTNLVNTAGIRAAQAACTFLASPLFHLVLSPC